MTDAWIAGASVCLADHITIPPLTNIILAYARYSEAELVFNVLMSAEHPMYFEVGFTPGPDGERDLDSSERCWINKYPPTKEIADDVGIDDWTPESRYKFSIGFGNYWDVYDEMIAVTIDDLVPSRGLKIMNVHGYEKNILDQCRDQYIVKMSELIRRVI